MDQGSVDPAVCGNHPVGVPTQVAGNKIPQKHARPVVFEYPGVRDPDTIDFDQKITPSPGSPDDLKSETNYDAGQEITGMGIQYLVHYPARIDSAENDREEDYRHQDFD